MNLFISFLAGKDLSESRFTGQYLESWYGLEAIENYKHTERKFWRQTLMFFILPEGWWDTRSSPFYGSSATLSNSLPTLPHTLRQFARIQLTSILCPQSARTILPKCNWFAHLWKHFLLITGAGSICFKTRFKWIWCNNYFWASILCKGVELAELEPEPHLTSSYLLIWTLKFFSLPLDHSFMNCGLFGPRARLPGFRPCLVTDLCPQNSLWSCPNFPVSWPFAWPDL